MTGSPEELALLARLEALGKPRLEHAKARDMVTERKLKLKPRAVRLRPGELERIQADYAKGLAIEDMAYKLGRTVGSVGNLVTSLRAKGLLQKRPRVACTKRLAVYHTGGRG